MRVLVSPDKFKGTLSAAEVSDAIAAGLEAAGAEAVTLPLADGGDGSVAAALRAGFSRRVAQVRGADGERVDAAFATDGTTAVVEVANTCGLSTLPAGVLAPLTSSSFGFGQAVLAARDAGARRIVLALGGSASTDGGAGMLAALGTLFVDQQGRTLDPTAALEQAVRLDTVDLVDLSGVELVVATDVANPLLGPHGAAAVFGPQKGADPGQVVTLDGRLARLVQLLPTDQGRDTASLANEPGAGAAGGLGFACRWLGARRVTGADFFLDLLRFDEAVAGCDAVVTGEGRMDEQTLSGKLPAVVAQRSRPRPVHAVVGQTRLDDEGARRLGLASIHPLDALTTADPSCDPVLSKALAAHAGEHIGHEILASSVSMRVPWQS